MFSVKKRNKTARLLLTVEYPPDNGGVGRYLESIVKEVADTEVVRPQFFNFFWPRWVKALVIPFIMKPKELWISHLLPLGYVALLYKVITSTPYTVFVHGTDLKFALKSSWKRFWATLILNHAKQIIANSQYTLSLVERLKIENKKLKIIYPCPTFAGEISVIKKPFTILSVGRLVPRKGFGAGIKVAVQLKKEFPALTYTIIGNGQERPILERLIKENNASDYIFLNTNVDDQALQNYYAESSILLAPGREVDGDVEGFGLVILEAAQFGTPAVATNIGGVDEAIVNGQTGILIPDNNVETIVSAVNKLFKDDSWRQKLGEAAKIRVEQEFNMNEQVKKIDLNPNA